MSDNVVRTARGRVRGRDEAGVVAFRGIPYAAAPEGPLRFRPPVPAEPWDGVREADAFAAPQPQPPAAPGVPPVWRPESGIAPLSVNVWTPDLGAAGLPVMVWIYGGVWRIGWSGMPQYDGAALARSGVVVVTFDYRVGFDGFGHVPGVPDNRGLRDQVAALEWVRDEIAGFGGDPGNVTVFGHSAGAASAVLHLATPATRGLFRRAIAQSVPAGVRTVDEAGETTRALAATVGAPATWDGLAALPPEAILAVPDAALTGGRPGTAYAPVVDGDLVTGPPWEALAGAAAPDSELVCGFTHEEIRGMPRLVPPDADLGLVAGSLGLRPEAAGAYRSAFPGQAEALAALMSDALVRMPTTWVAEAHARGGGRTWLYDFAWGGPTAGAAHGVDVPFTFGNADNRFAARFIGSPPPEGFAALSDRIRAAWTSFARTGDPGWPRFDLTHGRTRVWDDAPSDGAYPLPESRRIWDTYAAHRST